MTLSTAKKKIIEMNLSRFTLKTIDTLRNHFTFEKLIPIMRTAGRDRDVSTTPS